MGNTGQRNASGQFAAGNQVAKGNKGGPGRPPRDREQQYMTILQDTVTPEAWIRVAVRALQQAEAGDKWARAWLTNYLLGQPIARKEDTGTQHERNRELLERLLDARHGQQEEEQEQGEEQETEAEAGQQEAEGQGTQE